MQKEIIKMCREGTFKTKNHLKQQCGIVEIKEYSYMFIGLFDYNINEKTKFIIDHNDIDNFINNLKLEGSCEEINKKLAVSLTNFFRRKKVVTNAFKMTIKPIKTIDNKAFKGKAYMSIIVGKERYNSLLILD